MGRQYPAGSTGAPLTGGKIAIPAWLDRTVHQSWMRSAWLLAARGQRAKRPLQQLRRSPAQRAAPARSADAHAPAIVGRPADASPATLGFSRFHPRISVVPMLRAGRVAALCA